MDRRKTGNVVWFAFECAKQDRRTIIDAYRGDTREEAVREALADIKAFNRLQEKLFGPTENELTSKMKKMKPVTLFEIRKLIEKDWSKS